jgi:hypothetical protein
MANNSIDVWIEGGSKETLTDQHYKASGGEGTVYQKGGTAFKIMHPGHSVIQERKMQELHAIQASNVLIPLNYLLDKQGKKIGFTMRYVQDVEFLCKIFNNGFLQRNKISAADIVELVKEIQLTLTKIHDAKCLVVDFNQMNFLLDGKKFKTPFFIDTDSYQTPSCPATALMECVRDRKGPKNKFSTHTDWYSWAIISFWVYIGTHPYRGSHPNYSNNDWCGKRMDDGISVFNPDVSMPGNCRDFSVIPKPHLEWYKRVFEKGERSVPPLPDGCVIVPVSVVVKDVANFVTKMLFEYNSPIRRIFQDQNTRYVLTDDTLYRNEVPSFRYSGKYDKVGFIKVDGDDPVLVGMEGNNLLIYSWKEKQALHEMEAEDMMVHGGRVYTRSGNSLIEHTCTKIYDRTVHSVKHVANIFGPACNFFDGVIVQDILGKCMLTLCDDDGNFVNASVQELDKHRIIDGKCVKGVVVIISEKSGIFTRSVLTFSEHRSNYHIRTDEVDAGESAEFAVKSQGLCVGVVNDDLEAWSGNRAKVFKKSPIPSGSLMYTENDKTLFAVGNKLYVTEKK